VVVAGWGGSARGTVVGVDEIKEDLNCPPKGPGQKRLGKESQRGDIGSKKAYKITIPFR